MTMNKNAPTIGILGGTFDPVHLGHLHLANALLESFPLQLIKFIPCYMPVHRPPLQTTVAHRVAMLNLAIDNLPKLELDLREIERKEPSYMIDTLISLRHDYPESSLSLILGADAYQTITTWKRWQELLDYAHFIVINRNQIATRNENPFLVAKETNEMQDLLSKANGEIFFFKIEPCEISATEIRQAIHQGSDISQWVSPKVAEYIISEKLYK